MDGDVCVSANRQMARWAAGLFGLILVVGMSRTVSRDNVEGALIVLLVLGPLFAFYAYRAFHRGPFLVLGETGLTRVRSGKVIPWDKVSDIYLRQRGGGSGVYHHLVFTVRADVPFSESAGSGPSSSEPPQETIRLPIDQLSIGWREIVALVESRLGREVRIKKEAGIQLK